MDAFRFCMFSAERALRPGVMSTRALGLAVFICLGWDAGCSAVVDTDKAKLGPVPVPCEPGQTAPCPCRDGSTSVQKCNELARFDACACGGVAGRAGSAAAARTGSGAAAASLAGAASVSAEMSDSTGGQTPAAR